MANKKYIKIVVDGQEVDLPDELPNIELSFSLQDSIGTAQGARSTRSLNLPATKQNDTIFGRWWAVGESNLTSAEFKKSSIEVNGLPILNGQAQLKEVSTKGVRYERQGKQYKVAFFGDNADWFLQLKDKCLGLDLDWSSEIHTLGTVLISTRYNADPALVNYCYTIVKWQDWTGGTGDRVDVLQSTPALFIKAMLDKIFNSVGYTLSSAFMSTTVFARYIMLTPLVDKYPQAYSEDYLNVRATKTTTSTLPGSGIANFTGLDYDNQTFAPNIGPNPYLASVLTSVFIPPGGAVPTSRYTAPEYGFYEFRMSVIVSGIVGASSFGFGPLSLSPAFPSSTTDNVYSVTALDNGKRFTYSVVGELNGGDVVEFFFGGDAFAVFDVIGGTLEVIGESVIRDGSRIDFQYLLRDWKITDFLKGLTEAFNLMWQTDTATGVITVEPKDSHLLTNRAASTTTFVQGFHQDTTTDTTPKLDFEKDGRVFAVNDTSETQKFKWKSDNGDPTQEFINENEEVEVYAAEYGLPLNRFKQATEERENSFFAATLHLFDRQVTAASSTIVVQVPLIWSDNYLENNTSDEPNYNVEPRLLWFGGQRSGGDLDGTIKTSAGGIDSEVIMPAAFFVNYNDDTGLDVSLSFSEETVLNNVLVPGMLQRYHLRDMARLRAGKRRNEWVYYNELDILSLNFRPKILINGDPHLLQEVQGYSPIIDRSTKLVLVYDQCDEQQDVNRIQDSNQTGIISDFEYSEK
jgi:hypothetical protein